MFASPVPKLEAAMTSIQLCSPNMNTHDSLAHRRYTKFLSQLLYKHRVVECKNLGLGGVVLSEILVVVSIEDGSVRVALGEILGTRLPIYVVVSSSIDSVVRSLVDHGSGL